MLLFLLDVGLGEFGDVGETIEEFASENATVVIGTVIDPSMGEEIKVTVVATGLGSESTYIPEVQQPVERHVAVEQQSVLQDEPAPSEVENGRDYGQFDKPTVMRQPQRLKSVVGGSAAVEATPEDDMEFLDIPAFLRRQAD